jgi:hypothetical protein
MAWRCGDVVVLRELHCGQVYSGCAGRVVADDGARSRLYFAPGTTGMWPWARGAFLEVPEDRWQLRPGPWRPEGQLQLVGAGMLSHVSVLFSPDDGALVGFKVDFHEPVRRHARGYDALDWALDLMVDRDRRCRLRDEVEYAAYLAHGVITPQQADAVQAELAAVRAQVERGEAPFDDSFEGWKPDPAWGPVELPAGWDRLDD